MQNIISALSEFDRRFRSGLSPRVKPLDDHLRAQIPGPLGD